MYIYFYINNYTIILILLFIKKQKNMVHKNIEEKITVLHIKQYLQHNL